MKRINVFKDNLPKLTQEEIVWIGLITIKEIESIINNLPKQKAPGSDEFTGEFYQTFEKEIKPTQQELSFIAGENVKWYSHFRRQFVSFLQN